MTNVVTAVFEHGAFLPDGPCDLPEGTRVVLAIERIEGTEKPGIAPPEVKSVEERKRILREVVQRMKRNPLPPGAPRFKRSDMYDRG